jgi:hypothetical protein
MLVVIYRIENWSLLSSNALFKVRLYFRICRYKETLLLVSKANVHNLRDLAPFQKHTYKNESTRVKSILVFSASFGGVKETVSNRNCMGENFHWNCLEELPMWDDYKCCLHHLNWIGNMLDWGLTKMLKPHLLNFIQDRVGIEV